MNTDNKISIFWFRRDLRLFDNRALHEALKSGFPVLPVFIFDTEITEELPEDDARITFIYDNLRTINANLNIHKSGVYCLQGKPLDAWKKMLKEFSVAAVYANEDYEPYAKQRDDKIRDLLSEQGIQLHLFKDQVIFARDEILKKDATPYTVFTPYSKKWTATLSEDDLKEFPVDMWDSYAKIQNGFFDLEELGFKPSAIKVPEYALDSLQNYDKERNFPAMDGTSRLAPHLRFGTVSIRDIVSKVRSNKVFLNELIWREFFMQVLYHFPHVEDRNFRSKYDGIQWRNNPADFEKWKQGMTGYPMVDAGMRQLNASGYMHNRVRMVVASFLCKHLLIDWRWGEAYFAEKLLDYELSSNNGNWQWAAGTGCDAAPYFRVFNPSEQQKKFDPDLEYVKKWVPEFDSPHYPEPMVEHKFARERAISTYKTGLVT